MHKTAVASVLVFLAATASWAQEPSGQPVSQPNDSAPVSSPATETQAPEEPKSGTPKTQIPKPAEPKPQTPQTAARQEKEEEHEPADPDTGSSSLSDGTLGLLPNPLLKKGVKYSLSYIGETLANVSGGLKRGGIYDGRLNAAVDIDFKTLAGWSGLTFHANAFEIHGRGLSRNDVGNLMTVSGVEALATLRLYELWFEQKFAGDMVAIRAGQLTADPEFITTKYANALINASYGWPTITAVNLPSGGPSPPLAAVGTRLKVEVNRNVTFLAAAFNGDPAGPGPGDPQSRNRYGLNFRVTDPPLFINEIQYAYNQTKNANGLPGELKFGAWYHTGLFSDQRFAVNRLSQADPNASPSPAQLRGDYGLYAVFEQLLMAFSGSDGTRGVGLFTRLSGSPSDRNLIGFYVDGGLEITGAWDARPDDKIGIGFAYSRISDRARLLDADFAAFGNPRPIRSYEALVNFGYVYQVKKGWNLYPTLQYILHPGGGYVLDGGVAVPLHNATVIGLRTGMKF